MGIARTRGWVAAGLLALVATLATPAPAGAVAGFGDVASDAYYAHAVEWMVDRGITSGVSDGCFAPDTPTTRGMMATFLYRAQGSPAGGDEPFVDVGDNDFFHDAVAWMYSEGITTGATPTRFEPDRLVTRGEMATFIHRAEGSPVGGDEPFVDVGANAFFHDAVAWMVGAGVTEGTSPTTFAPYRPITRGEIAAFLYRVAGSPAVTLSGAGGCPSTGPRAELAAAEARSLELLNELRADLGHGPVTRRAEMDDFARDWSEEMDRSGDFRHSTGPWAENIAWWSAGWATPTAAAERLHDLWMNSAGHYANMTRASHTEVGIGFWRSDDGGWHATHVFR